jgi:malonyl-CoA/methylmalonyl-CoA synthetase
MSNHFFDKIRQSAPPAETLFLTTETGVALTYGGLMARSAQFANVLTALGVGKGDRVAVQTQKAVDCLMLYLACLRAGAVYLPLNTAYTPAEIGYFVGDAKPLLFVCDPASRDSLAAALAGLADLPIESLSADGGGSLQQQADVADKEFADVAAAPDDLAAILYTSGTTGRSKGAMLTQDNLTSNAEALVDAWHFTGEDVLLHILPIFHTHGLFVATNTVLLAGASMLFLHRFDLDTALSLFPKSTAMMGVPTHYSRLLSRADFNRDLIGHMRLFISGSAPLSAETHKAFAARTGHAILERYGMTETGMNTSNPYDGERRPGTIGMPLPGVELRITDPATGAALRQGEIGVIEVRGPNVFRGYWQNPEKTAEEFRDDGFFITGDLARIDADGYVTIVGRDKDLIITGGFNVYPAEVEAVLDACPGIAESAVIGVPHPDFGEGVTGIVAAKSGAQIDEAEIQARLAGELAAFKHPKRIITVDVLPRNSMGKIQKNDLRDQYRGLYAAP